MIEVVRCFLAIQLAKFGDLPSNNMWIPLWRFQPWRLGLARPWSAFTGGSFKTFILTSAARFDICFKFCHGDWTVTGQSQISADKCLVPGDFGCSVASGCTEACSVATTLTRSHFSRVFYFVACCIRTHDMPKVQQFIWSSKATQGCLVINYAHIIGLVYRKN